MRRRQPSDTGSTRGGVDQVRAPFEEWELLRIEQLAAARLDEMAWMPLVDQPEQREQPAPAAAPLVHGVGIERGVLDKPRVQAAHGIARLVDFARATIKARRQEIAILGIENEDEPHQDREQALVEMPWPGARQLPDELWLGGVEPAQQLMQGAEHLLGERGRDRSLCFPALPEQRGQTALVGIGEQANGIEQQLEPAKHRPAGDGGERAQRKCQIARGLARRRVDQPQFRRIVILAILAFVLLGDEQPGEDACLAQQSLEALMRRCLPAFEGSAPIRIDAGASIRTSSCQACVAVAQFSNGPSRAQRRVVLRQADVKVVRQCRAAGLPATCRASQPSTSSNEAPGMLERRAWTNPLRRARQRTAVSAWVCREGARPSSLSRTGATTKPTGRT